MKLTNRGKDFLKASLVGAIASSIFDVRLFVALCLTLALCAALSQLTLVFASRKNIEIVFDDIHLSCFKGGSAQETVHVASRRRRLIGVSVSEIRAPNGVDAEIDREDPDSKTFLFRPRYAGRFVGLTAKLELRDPLELFRKSISITQADFTIDCYPSSLLTDIRASRPVTLALGERTGRVRGSGQEFHSIEDYHQSVERKNILWKKIAAMPDERLLVKVRESNIPKTLTIGLIKTVRRQDHLRWTDLACEATAILGKTILAIGCDVQIEFASIGGVAKRYVTELSGLSDAIMEMSSAGLSSIEIVSEILSESDVCVTGLREIESDLVAGPVAKKPAVLVEEEGIFPKLIGDSAIVFNGDQDVGELVNKVVGR